jgi:hypothetical protein
MKVSGQLHVPATLSLENEPYPKSYKTQCSVCPTADLDAVKQISDPDITRSSIPSAV